MATAQPNTAVANPWRIGTVANGSPEAATASASNPYAQTPYDPENGATNDYANAQLTGGGTAKPTDPIPKAPSYVPGYNPSTMATLPGYEAEVNANSAGLNALSTEALRGGASTWDQLAKSNSALQEQTARENDTNQAMGATSAAKSALAAQGGLSSGANERMDEQGTKSLLSMSQDSARAGQSNALNIDMQDQKDKLAALGQLPGDENQLSQGYENARNTDNSMQINETGALNAYNQNLYNQAMTAKGAQETAEAQQNSGKK